MEMQTVGSQKGEILFRRKLVRQQVHGETLVPDELEAAEIERVLEERMARTRRHVQALQRSGVRLAPFVEIGAERGQRALILENDLGVTGAAVDVSFDVLESCGHYAAVFGMEKLPLRVCCDANLLPFRAGSIPFIFCYETLHHFPQPGPIIAEIDRALAPGGWFLFDEEPCKKALQLVLYRRPKAYSAAARRRGLLARALDAVFSTLSCNELEHGIVENHSIPLSTWHAALAPFQERRVLVLPKGPEALRRFLDHDFTDLSHSRSRLKQCLSVALAWLMGGVVSGVCRKPGRCDSVEALEDCLICPACREAGAETVLSPVGECYECPACGARHPVVHGVLFLFTPAKMRELYPEFAGGASTPG